MAYFRDSFEKDDKQTAGLQLRETGKKMCNRYNPNAKQEGLYRLQEISYPVQGINFFELKEGVTTTGPVFVLIECKPHSLDG